MTTTSVLPVDVLAGHVLVLNASYEPLQRVSLKHAIKMLVREVAVIHEHDDDVWIGPFRLPRVLRLVRYVKTAWKYRNEVRCTKDAVKRRDGACAYCLGPAETVDHVLPRSRGGGNGWLNLVGACIRCNHRKADRTPQEAGMKLRIRPYVPAVAP